MDHIKDLGVILDSGLSFKIHYNNIVNRANRQLGFIFKLLTSFVIRYACSLVRSILETNAVVWCPFYANWMARIEAVQRKLIK